MMITNMNVRKTVVCCSCDYEHVKYTVNMKVANLIMKHSKFALTVVRLVTFRICVSSVSNTLSHGSKCTLTQFKKDFFVNDV